MFEQRQASNKNKGGKEMYYLKRLKDLRKNHQLKQQNLAEVLKITRQQYSLYEVGTREIPVHHLKTLAQFYNISTDYILEIINQM